MQQKRIWKQIDGVLLLDKPLGMTSNDALQKARRLFSAAKAGHTGTLDPLATGLLPLCFGEATKFSADLLDADKTYVARLKFGIATDSGDAEGRVISTRAVNFGETELQALLPRFSGEIQQVPPMYSALKRDGRPLYELARQGIEVERQPRAVTIYALELLESVGDEAVLRVACSKGTYIRSLAMDLGEALGCGAHLIGLRRTDVGRLKLEQAVTLETLAALEEEKRSVYLLAPDALLQNLPRVDLGEAECEYFMHGNPVAAPAELSGRCRVYAGSSLLGLGEVREDKLWPKRLVQLAIA
ncbi:MAG: tRNA pseudouridine synthase [Proteobacteria bacterium]|nr:tRNA pseudouridine synthase [Pseudomonadota bacterium]